MCNEDGRSSSTTPTIIQKRKEQKKRKIDPVDEFFMKERTNISQEKEEKNVYDSDTLFCKSLVTHFYEMTPEQNMLAKMKVMQVLYEIKFNKSGL